MGKCEFCGEKVVLPFQCSFCGGYFCNEHLPLTNYMCAFASKEHMFNEATSSETLWGSLLFVGMIVFCAFIMAVIVLAVDAVALLLLNLWNVSTWLTLLWWEGIIMGFFGAVAGLTHHKAPVPWPTPMGTRLYRLNYVVQEPLFWASLGLAGLMLIICANLI